MMRVRHMIAGQWFLTGQFTNSCHDFLVFSKRSANIRFSSIFSKYSWRIYPAKRCFLACERKKTRPGLMADPASSLLDTHATADSFAAIYKYFIHKPYVYCRPPAEADGAVHEKDITRCPCKAAESDRESFAQEKRSHEPELSGLFPAVASTEKERRRRIFRADLYKQC